MPYVISLARVQALPTLTPGTCVLVDGLWPRGITKAALSGILWYRDVCPAPVLRQAFHKGALSQEAFFRQYRQQLDLQPDSLVPLMQYARRGELTLLTATRDAQHSYLSVLRQALLDALITEDRECGDSEPSSPVCYAHLMP